MTALLARATTVLAVLAATVVVGAAPASAAVHGYELELARGIVSLGAVVDTSWDGTPHDCWGRTSLTGTIDDSTGSDNMTGTFEHLSDDFTNPYVAGHFVLQLDGSAVGVDAGDHDSGTQGFTGLHVPLAFAIRSIDPVTCALGATVCAGSTTLTLTGTLLAGPPYGPGTEADLASTAGVITSLGSCGQPWRLMLPPGAATSLIPLIGSGDPGARFVHPLHAFDAVMSYGHVTMGPFAMDAAGSYWCQPSTIGLTGTIDTSTGTDNITATLGGQSADLYFATDLFVVSLSGSAAGADAGDWSPATQTFTDLHFPSVTVTVERIDPMTCVIGPVVCVATVTLTLTGGIGSGSDVPLTTGEELAVASSAGEVLTKGPPCSSWWNAFLYVSAPVSIGPDPGGPDPFGYFAQQ